MTLPTPDAVEPMDVVNSHEVQHVLASYITGCNAHSVMQPERFQTLLFRMFGRYPTSAEWKVALIYAIRKDNDFAISQYLGFVSIPEDNDYEEVLEFLKDTAINNNAALALSALPGDVQWTEPRIASVLAGGSFVLFERAEEEHGNVTELLPPEPVFFILRAYHDLVQGERLKLVRHILTEYPLSISTRCRQRWKEVCEKIKEILAPEVSLSDQLALLDLR